MFKVFFVGEILTVGPNGPGFLVDENDENEGNSPDKKRRAISNNSTGSEGTTKKPAVVPLVEPAKKASSNTPSHPSPWFANIIAAFLGGAVAIGMDNPMSASSQIRGLVVTIAVLFAHILMPSKYDEEPSINDHLSSQKTSKALEVPSAPILSDPRSSKHDENKLVKNRFDQAVDFLAHNHDFKVSEEDSMMLQALFKQTHGPASVCTTLKLSLSPNDTL